MNNYLFGNNIRYIDSQMMSAYAYKCRGCITAPVIYYGNAVGLGQCIPQFDPNALILYISPHQLQLVQSVCYFIRIKLATLFYYYILCPTYVRHLSVSPGLCYAGNHFISFSFLDTV